MERRELITGGDAPGGYGHGGTAVPFLSVEENGRLPDPYGRMASATVLDQIRALVETKREPSDRPMVRGDLAGPVKRLSTMAKEDPGNPELRWLLGRALEQSGDLPGAKEAYGEAWRLGQRDARTLVRWAGVDAGSHESEALAHLRKHLGEVSEDVQVRLLEGMLLCDLGQTEEARAAFRAAAAAARSERERARAARALEDSPCR
jgi:tetratricopeptide (TPR) repeat protein